MSSLEDLLLSFVNPLLGSGRDHSLDKTFLPKPFTQECFFVPSLVEISPVVLIEEYVKY